MSTQNPLPPSTSTPQQLLSLSKEELFACMKELSLPSYRAKQLYSWVYQKGTESYDLMSNLPLKLREHLKEVLPLTPLVLLEESIAADGTRKFLFKLFDNQVIEAVSIPSGKFLTVCCSTQVGCPMACAFCATGKEGFTRNLFPGEIVGQILYIQNHLGTRVSNVVFMGQGEPFLNYQSVINALHIINDEDGVGIGARHITISSCGIIPSILKFSQEPEQFTLAISLHSAQQPIRDALMPKVSSFPLAELKRSLEHYIQQTNRRITFEYALIRDINDDTEALHALISFCSDLLCHINLIPLNMVEDSPFIPSSLSVLHHWEEQLNKVGISTTIRNSKGSDIAGACGQLKNKRFS